MVNKLKLQDKIILICSIVVIAICWFFILNLGYISDLSKENPNIGRARISGPNVRKKEGSEYFWKNIKDSSGIYNGDSYFVGKGSAADIKFNDGSSLKLKENSLVKFDNTKNRLFVDIVFGQVLVDSKFKAISIKDCGKDIQIDSKNAVFDINKGKECGDLKINVKSGEVKFGDNLVAANTNLNIHKYSSEATLDKVIKFIQRPRNVKGLIRIGGAGGLEFLANWDPVKSANEYELEISPDFKMQGSSLKFTVKTNSFVLPDAKMEKIYYRIRANESTENKGAFGPVETAEVRESLAIPKIETTGFEAPAPGVLSFNLNWLPVEKASQYRIELSPTLDFSKLQTQSVTELKAKFSDIGYAEMYVRLRAENKYAQSEYSQPQHVSLKLAAPKIKMTYFEATAQNKLALNLNWLPVEKASQYRIEISETADFLNAQSQTIKALKTKFQSLGFTEVYVRARAENRNVNSDYSKPQRVSFNYEAKAPTDKVLFTKCIVQNRNESGPKKDFVVNWEPVPMADKYSLKIINNKNINQVDTAQSRGPASEITLPACGEYNIKVEAFDKSGRKISSEFNAAKIIYKSTLDLLKPTISATQKNLNIFFQKGLGRFIWLSWRSELKAGSDFIVEVAADVGFKTNYMRYKVRDNKLMLNKKLQSGQYFWRVREQNAELFSEWSDVARIKINADNAKPK